MVLLGSCAEAGRARATVPVLQYISVSPFPAFPVYCTSLLIHAYLFLKKKNIGIVTGSCLLDWN